ncbi:phosphatidylserine decarboxylase [Wolbachia pipientis]|uniref:Phosphatidylserine decarboxylase proenzyme n=1 Tax=Wolbachia pipientis TaxID=955 RepID=A0A1E7QL05_WOLPI|nr:phosphatidylserine decarboxylase [Wolbachia pipientis]OEY87087.1 phosphatidylserine decarboxylase [Wolbachia pipientis]
MCFNLPNINRGGYPFIIIFFIASCIAFSISWGLGMTCLLPTLLCIYFFRDPARIIPENTDFILSPADGVITKIDEVSHPDAKEEKKLKCISIFLSVLNVHVTRIPISGTVKEMHYKKGKFVYAMNNSSCNENEKQVIIIEYQEGKEIIVEQVAGFIARRIVCNLQISQNVKAGERFGIIRFGSRVNVFIPTDLAIRVNIGQTVIAGETVIAGLNQEGEKLAYNVI